MSILFSALLFAGKCCPCFATEFPLQGGRAVILKHDFAGWRFYFFAPALPPTDNRFLVEAMR